MAAADDAAANKLADPPVAGRPLQLVAGGGGSDGSDWSEDGVLTSDSATTVRWDNRGNLPENTVSRDPEVPLLHTDQKTYGDIAKPLVAGYEARFGAESPLGGLEVTVGQTEGLVSQAVRVSFSGLSSPQDASQPGYLQVFQCWGALTADGAPDPTATAPDPATCQVGAVGADQQSENTFDFRSIYGDPLVAGGDWDQEDTDPEILPSTAPFLAVDGNSSRNSVPGRSAPFTREYANPYFSKTTTNEMSAFRTNSTGQGSRAFDVQTGSEAPGLGCGYRTDVPSVRDCWLVVVPRPELAQGRGVYTELGADQGPVAPSVWAQRLQVKLNFQDVADSCPSGQSRSLTAGSALLTVAMASWIPGLCRDEGLALGYSTVGDQQARSQMEAGQSSALFTTKPVDLPSASHAMVGLGAVVIAYTADQRGDYPAPGTQLSGLKLTPRLVAKLLTQSYVASIDNYSNTQMYARAPWVLQTRETLMDDPEFLNLNPDVAFAGSNKDFSDLLVETMRTDAADSVWHWLDSDPVATSFLNGCPDEFGMVINPFYSRGTYQGCAKQAKKLEQAAQEKRDQTDVPDTFTFNRLDYPSSSAAYPLPGWYERAAITVPEVQAVATLGDLNPRQDTMAATGRSAFRAAIPEGAWCSFASDDTCLPKPGRWKTMSAQQFYGSRTAMAITDAATAARYQMTTFKLCDSTGTHCVGANTESLEIAASGFEQTAVDGVYQPATAPDYAGGAYPLTLPIYAAVKMDGLTQADAAAMANTIQYATTTGQRPGFGTGSLPPGYAPISPEMQAAARPLMQQLRTVVDPPRVVVAPPTRPLPPPPPRRPPTRAVPAAQPPAAVTAPAAPELETVAQVGVTPPTEVGFPQLGLILGLLAALAGLLAPIVGRQRKVREQE